MVFKQKIKLIFFFENELFSVKIWIQALKIVWSNKLIYSDSDFEHFRKRSMYVITRTLIMLDMQQMPNKENINQIMCMYMHSAVGKLCIYYKGLS